MLYLEIRYTLDTCSSVFEVCESLCGVGIPFFDSRSTSHVKCTYEITSYCDTYVRSVEFSSAHKNDLLLLVFSLTQHVVVVLFVVDDYDSVVGVVGSFLG